MFDCDTDGWNAIDTPVGAADGCPSISDPSIGVNARGVALGDGGLSGLNSAVAVKEINNKSHGLGEPRRATSFRPRKENAVAPT